jgi:hypothetical protein
VAHDLFADDIAWQLGNCSAVDGGKYYVCTCPAHNDQGSALCIGDNRGGGGVWAKCTSGCTEGAVQRALQSRRLWPSGGHRKTGSSLEAAKQRRRERERQQYNAEIVEILSPVPKNAPPIDWARLSNEPLSSIHEYKDENGRLLFCVAQRVELLGGKLYRPAVFVKRRDGQFEWAFEYPNEPRALYGLDLLARMPDADVLIVESEETADAARVLLPQNVVLTWFGGSRAIDSADWTRCNAVVALFCGPTTMRRERRRCYRSKRY